MNRPPSHSLGRHCMTQVHLEDKLPPNSPFLKRVNMKAKHCTSPAIDRWLDPSANMFPGMGPSDHQLCYSTPLDCGAPYCILEDKKFGQPSAEWTPDYVKLPQGFAPNERFFPPALRPPLKDRIYYNQ